MAVEKIRLSYKGGASSSGLSRKNGMSILKFSLVITVVFQNLCPYTLEPMETPTPLVSHGLGLERFCLTSSFNH